MLFTRLAISIIFLTQLYESRRTESAEYHRTEYWRSAEWRPDGKTARSWRKVLLMSRKEKASALSSMAKTSPAKHEGRPHCLLESYWIRPHQTSMNRPSTENASSWQRINNARNRRHSAHEASVCSSNYEFHPSIREHSSLRARRGNAQAQYRYIILLIFSSLRFSAIHNGFTNLKKFIDFELFCSRTGDYSDCCEMGSSSRLTFLILIQYWRLIGVFWLQRFLFRQWGGRMFFLFPLWESEGFPDREKGNNCNSIRGENLNIMRCFP